MRMMAAEDFQLCVFAVEGEVVVRMVFLIGFIVFTVNREIEMGFYEGFFVSFLLVSVCLSSVAITWLYRGRMEIIVGGVGQWRSERNVNEGWRGMSGERKSG